MNGVNIAQSAHVVNILPPVSISGGVTAQAIGMYNAEHVSFIIQFGAFGAAVPTAILLNACTSAAGAGATPIGFKWWYQSTAGAVNDVLSTPFTLATASGIPAASIQRNNNTFIVIEVDAAELEIVGNASTTTLDTFKYLQLQITDSGNVTYASAVAVLSGLRHAYDGGLTVTA